MRALPPSLEPPLRKLATAFADRRLPERTAVILMYHRVADVAFDPWRLAVSPRHFAEQLEVLRSRFRPLPLSELAAAAEAGDIPPRAVALTFDDGYRDVHDCAAPLLAEYGIPATVFVTSGCVGTQQRFWWDELEHVCFSGERPAERTEVAGTVVDWSRPPADLYHDLWARLQPLGHVERSQQLAALAEETGVSGNGRREVLSDDELRALSGQRVEVGAHTVTHTPLPTLPPERQLDEARQSREELERVLGAPVESFSYPHGLYTSETVECIRSAGFVRACNSREAPVHPGSERFELPRCRVESWPGEQFAWRLVKYFRADGDAGGASAQLSAVGHSRTRS